MEDFLAKKGKLVATSAVPTCRYLPFLNIYIWGIETEKQT